MSEKDLEETIVKLKTIVYKTLVDPSTVKLICEREKQKLFTKMGFIKPKKTDIKFEMLEKFYDPFFVIKGRYFIDYYSKRVYNLDVDEDFQELLLFNRVLKPKMPTLAKLRGKVREVTLDAELRFVKENFVYIILDKRGGEVDLETFPTAPMEENPNQVLTDARKRVWIHKFSPDQAMEIFRSKVISRPSDANRMRKELLEVSEFNLVYVPIYQTVYRKVNNGTRKSVMVDGVTSLIVSRQNENKITSKQRVCPKCGNTPEENGIYCRECGQPF